MKKFVIISVVLLLLAAGAFGFALYRYMQVNDMFSAKEPAPTEAVAEKIILQEVVPFIFQ